MNTKFLYLAQSSLPDLQTLIYTSLPCILYWIFIGYLKINITKLSYFFQIIIASPSFLKLPFFFFHFRLIPKYTNVVKIWILFLIVGSFLNFISCNFPVPANLHVLVSLLYSLPSWILISGSLFTINPLDIYHQHEFLPWWKLFNHPLLPLL